MAKYTKEQVMQMVRENNVRFIRLQFTAILRSLKTWRSPTSNWKKR